jgi:hypothetical protein
MSCQGKLAHVSVGDRGTRPGIYHRGDAACPGSIVVRLWRRRVTVRALTVAALVFAVL